jgi:hypothetical protein
MIDQVMPAIHWCGDRRVQTGRAIRGCMSSAPFSRPLGSSVSLSDLISSVTPAGKVWRLDGLLKALLAASQPRSSSGVF